LLAAFVLQRFFEPKPELILRVPLGVHARLRDDPAAGTLGADATAVLIRLSDLVVVAQRNH
jgi:hypothetical protein